MATSLGTLSPFRYRGYDYDEETGLYYLRSRYYNHDWGRFINADSVLGKPGKLLGHNVFTYCGNNPICFIDEIGQGSWYNLKWGYKYRIDIDGIDRHIHIRDPITGKDWKQTSDGNPYEPNHKSTLKGKPPRRVRDLLKRIMDDDDDDDNSSNGDGWDWDGNEEKAKQNSKNSNQHNIDEAINVGGNVIVAGGTIYLIYRTVRLLPSLFPPLWWTLPANIATP